MAVDEYDPVTGRPIFKDTGAPDIGVDPTEVGKYAADVGNRIVRDNLAGLNAYPYKRQGLMGYAIDTKIDYIHDGTGWVRFGGGEIVPLTAFSPNWSQTGGYSTFLFVEGKKRFLHGAATRGAGGLLTSMLVVPSGHRPSENQFLPGNVTGGGVAYALGIQSNGIIWAPYGGGSATGVYPLAGQWEVP